MFVKMRKPRYIETIPARFFYKNNPKLPVDKIWFHANSLGEVKGLVGIAEQFKKDDLCISVSTNTGHKQAHEMTNNVRYLPFEIFLPFWVVKQKILVVTEAELWYMLFYMAKRKSTPTFMINARVNSKKYEKYKKFAWLYKRIFKNIDKVYAQRESDKTRLEELGAKNVCVTGNIKLVNMPRVTRELKKPKGMMIVAASTHRTDKEEEKLILDAWDRTQGRLVIVPRHPERFDEVDELIEEYIAGNQLDLSYHRYSNRDDFDSDIVLVDMMGELVNTYAISDIVILGGAFCTTEGGHNPIEPAYFGNILISGDLIYHQHALFEHCADYYLATENKLKEYLDKTKNGTLKKSSVVQAGDVNMIIDDIKQIIKRDSNG